MAETPEIYLPTLHSFANQNIFTGSLGELRFRIAPQVVMAGKEANLEQSSMVAELWHGRLCYELSEMEAQQTFPMSEEGRANMLAWLEAHI